MSAAGAVPRALLVFLCLSCATAEWPSDEHDEGGLQYAPPTDPSPDPGPAPVPGPDLDPDRTDEPPDPDPDPSPPPPPPPLPEPVPCDTAVQASLPADYLRALELCTGPAIATLPSPSSYNGRALPASFGVITPRLGKSMVALSTGMATALSLKQPGGNHFTQAPHPFPLPASVWGCAAADESIVYDYEELSIELAVPPGAHSFSFAWFFMSSEFPEGVCWPWLDTFLVQVTGTAFQGNAVKDGAGEAITSDSTFMTVCHP